jgi:hypothetical protein
MVADVMINFKSLRRASSPFKWPSKKIDVEAAFVGFVEDDGIVFREIGIALSFRQQNAIGH